MMGMTEKTRHQAGAPASQGGQFKAHTRSDSDIALEARDAADHKAMSEDEVLAVVGIDRANVKSIKVGGGTAHIFLNEPHRTGEYDEIRIVDDGAISYLRDGKLHCNDYFAINWRGDMGDGRDFEAFHHGKPLHDPAPELGLIFRGIDKDGIQNWSSGNNAVCVDEEGTAFFYRDGDLHRDGAPAVVRPNGDDEWWIHDKQIPSPWPKPARRKERSPGVTQVTGASFEEGRDIKDVAARLREDIKAAQYAGILPGGGTIDVKVTIGRAAKSESVNVSVSGLYRTDILNPHRNEPGEPFHTAEGERIIATLNTLGDDYNNWTEGPNASAQERAFWLNANLDPTK